MQAEDDVRVFPVGVGQHVGMPLPPMFDVLLRFADEALDAMQASYLEHGDQQGVPAHSQYLVKRASEDYRSALDWLANAIWVMQGSLGSRSPYYPICKDQKTYEKVLARDFRGLDVSHPELEAVLRASQPYNPGFEGLGHLPELSNGNKHRQFTSQSRTAGNHTQMFFGGMGLMSFGPDGMTIGAAPPPEVVGGGSTGAFTEDGLSGSLTTPAYSWRFVVPADVPVLGALREIQRIVTGVLDEAGHHIP